VSAARKGRGKAGGKAGGGGGSLGLVRRRITFGLTMLAVLGGLMVLDHRLHKGYGLAAVIALCMTLGVREMLRLLEGLGPVCWRGPATLTALVLVFWQLGTYEGSERLASLGDPALLVLLGFVMALFASGLAHAPSSARLASYVRTSFAVVYVLGLGSFALKLRYVGDVLPGRYRSLDLGYWAVLYAILVAKGTDIGAFFIGRWFGRRKMIPWISPGKTMAGGAGALLAGVLVTLGFCWWSPLGQVIAWPVGICLGILLALWTIVGDLVESMIKRSAAVKDSGRLVPEFGGVLDIIDSILFVLPVVYVAVRWAAG